MKKTKKSKIKPEIIKGLKFYSFQDILKEELKSPTFRKAYEDAKARRRLQLQLREARIAKKLSQNALAEKVSMPQSVIARIESGERNLSVETLVRVAHAVGKELQLA